MGSDAPRALVLGGLREQGIFISDIAALCDGGQHSPQLRHDGSICRNRQ